MNRKRKVSISLAAISLCILLVGCSVKDTQGTISNQGTSQFSSKAVPAISQVKWQKKLGQGISFNYGEENIYYWRGKDLYTVDYETGEEKWSHRMDKQVVVAMDTNGITLANGDDSMLYAYKSEDGKLKWEKDVGDYFDILSVDNKLILLSNIDGKLIGLDLETGKEKWSKDNISQLSSSLTPIYKGIAYIQTDQGGIEAVSLDTGEVKGKINLKESGKLKKYMVADNTLFSLNSNLEISAYDIKNGNIKWTYSDNDRDFIAFNNGVVYALTQSTIKAIDASTGVLKKEIKVSNDDVLSTPLSIADDTIYVGTKNSDGNGGKVVAIDGAKGTIEWSYKSDDFILIHQPLIRNQKLYAINKEASIIAFSGNKGM